MALLNNLGGASVLEMAVLTAELRRSTIGEHVTHLVGPAALMTSLDMHGFSLSIFEADAEDIALLAAPCGVRSWPGAVELVPDTVLPLPDGLAPIKAMPSAHAPTRAFLMKCCEVLIEAEDDLNALDAKSGDGDTGSTLAGAGRALIAAMDSLPLADHTQLYRAIEQELSQAMGGSSGVLLAIFFAAVGDATSSGMPLRDALMAGLERMQEIGGARVGDRTMVDALKPALDELGGGISSAAKAARAGANHTASMTRAKAGRATYISAEQLHGHIDPGAEAVARLFEHLAS